MIRLQKIHVHEFRGIRDLNFEFNGENFSICGPNGTGKSGIVDAIEFVLTGNVSRLTGQGTGGLSVKEYGPHVDSRDKPNESFVSLTFHIPSLSKEVTIRRTVKDARSPTVTPNDAEIEEILANVNQHPEFVLSRRELIRYVLSGPGDRSKEVQALLRLDKLETLRTNFQKIANDCERESKPLKNNKQTTKDALITALGIPQLTDELVLTEVNKRRALLSLLALNKLENNISIKDGLVTAENAISTSKVPKAQAVEDLKDLKEKLESIKKGDFIAKCRSVVSNLKDLNSVSVNLADLSKESLLHTALELFNDKECPVCGTEWDPEKFRNVVNEQMEKLQSLTAKKQDIEKQIGPITNSLDSLSASLNTVSNYGSLLAIPIDVTVCKKHVKLLNEISRQLMSLIPINVTIEKLNEIETPQAVTMLVEEIEKAVQALPEPSQQDTARDYLVIGQERLETYRKASQQLDSCLSRVAIAKKIQEKYGEIVTAELNEIYKDVEKAFSNFYRVINRNDEAAFEAKLIPSIGKLSFDVDFYGRGFFPPGAYHSEGHQDGMGLCLYLALMQHLLRNNFTFAVLDDVLMSVDAGHRREVCTLLKQEFPDTQFILTTHDDIWLRHMTTAGLVKRNNFIHFRTWSVESGPTEWNDRDVWQEIERHLSSNDVRAAAALLRHYLEYISKEICHYLGATVVFRGDAQFTLNDLLPPGISAMRKLLKEGKDVAASWGQEDNANKIQVIEGRLETASRKSDVDKWQINAAVHYNEWATLHKNDFQPIAEAFRELVANFECPKCNEFLYVVKEQGKKQGLRCGCGSININLVKKA